MSSTDPVTRDEMTNQNANSVGLTHNNLEVLQRRENDTHSLKWTKGEEWRISNWRASANNIHQAVSLNESPKVTTMLLRMCNKTRGVHSLGIHLVC